MTVVLDTHDLQRHHVAFFNHFLRVVDTTVDELRDVHQAFHRPRQPSERAERDKLGHHAGHHVAHGVTGDQILPLLGRCAPDGQGNLLALLVNLHDEDLDLFANTEALFRVRVAIPRELREVRQSVGAAEVHEHTEVADRSDPTGANLALVQLVQQAVLLLGAPLLQRRTLREDRAVAAAVDLDHLQAKGTTHLLCQRGGPVGARLGANDLRHRDERVHALHVRQQSALVVAGHLALEDVAILEALLQRAPALFAARAVDREQHLALVRFRLHHVHQHALADCQLGSGVDAERVHLAHGDHAFGLGTDVDEVNENPVTFRPHHDAFDDFTSPQ